jgi:ribosomal protein S18 acetylase RimI-like enzyme
MFAMVGEKVHVRAAKITDREAFARMWEDFVALIPSEPGNRAMTATNWSRLMDQDNPLRCIFAVDGDDRPIGFTLFLTFPFTWAEGDACYLLDIYVRSESRGRGAAQAMIAHLAALGRASGWFKIFWMTQPDNDSAQRLYDKLAQRMDYIRYDLAVSES